MQPLEVYYLISSYNSALVKTNKYNDSFDQHALVMNNTEFNKDIEEEDILYDYWINRTGGHHPFGFGRVHYFFNCQSTKYLNRQAFIPDSVQSIVVNPQPTNTEPVIADHLMGSALIPEFMEIIKDEIGATAIYSTLASGVRLVDNYNQRMEVNNAFRYFDGMPNETYWGNIKNGVRYTRTIYYSSDGTTTSDDTTTSEITHSSEPSSYQIRVSGSGNDYYISKRVIITVSFEADIAFVPAQPNFPPEQYPYFEADLFEKIRFYLREKTYDNSEYVFDKEVLATTNGDVVNLTAPMPSGYPMDSTGTYTNYANYYRETFEMKNLSVADLAGIYGLPY